jgi:hypothetical protein
MPDVVTTPQPLSSTTFTNQVIAFGHAEFIQTDNHETILQALNRWMNYDNGLKIYLDAEAFQGTESLWDAVPLIFAQDHPEDFALVDTDLEAALNTVKDYQGNPGTVCGALTSTNVQIPGQPRLTSQVSFTDPAVQDLYQQGKLSLSTGFTCNVGNDGHLTDKVRPNHVLVFVQDEKFQPRDKAAMFLNTEHIKEDTMDVTNAGRVISDKNQSRFKQAVDALTTLFNEMTGIVSDNKKKTCENTGPSLPAKTPDIPATNQDKDNGSDEMAETELKNQIDAANTTIAAKDTEIVNRDAEIKTLKERNLELSNTLAAAEQAKKDAAWTDLKNKLPPGLVDTPEKETKLREMEPMALANMIAGLKMKAPTAEEGLQHPPAGKETPVKNTGIGTWDAKNRCYKD